MNNTVVPVAREAKIGDNQPPTIPKTDADLAAEMRAELEITYAETITRSRQLEESFTGVPETLDATTAKQAADYMTQLGAVLRTAEDARTKENAPYLRGQRVINGLFKDIMEPLEKAKKTVNERVTKYLQKVAADEAKRVREAAEKARREQEAAEAAAAAARAKVEEKRDQGKTVTVKDVAAVETAQEKADYAAANLERVEDRLAVAPSKLGGSIRGSLGKAISLKRNLTYKDLDKDKIDLEKLRPYFTQDALEKAVRAYINANRPSDGQEPKQIAGVTLYYEVKS